MRATTKRSIAALTGALLCAVTACEPAIHVYAAQSVTAHLERYGAVAFDLSPEAPSTFATSPQSMAVTRKVRDVAADVLESHGYRLSQSDADLILRVQAGRRVPELVVSFRPVPVVVTSTRADTDLRAMEVPSSVDAAFTIDAFDAKTHEWLWRGAAETEIIPGQIDEGRLARATEALLASFPSHAAP